MAIFLPLLIYLLVPALGLWAYVRLAKRMEETGEPTWLGYIYFGLFFCWGGVLLILLTSLLWAWSGMASLGTFFLLLIAGPVALLLSPWLFYQRQLSRWRAGAFWASIAFVMLWLAFGVLFTSNAL